jgi:molybdopterin/thiamine biosynthesis adenylyltransferase
MLEIFTIMQWSTEKAFSRNVGLISEVEQHRLAKCLIVIPGCGGIGSTVAETLARLGVGCFRLCDPDHFDIANFNRQTGATLKSLNVNKANATKERILSINPKAEIEIFDSPVSPSNVDNFIRDADVVLDGLDFFALTARRALFRAARKASIPAMTAAPLGFSATFQVYLPNKGMSFEEFFNFCDSDGAADSVMKFLVGLAPKALHKDYMDLSRVNVQDKSGPSSILGTQLASALIGGEVIRLVLNRGGSLPAPWFQQFDCYRNVLVKKKLLGGNRHPMQKLKLILAKQSFQKKGLWDDLSNLSLA